MASDTGADKHACANASYIVSHGHRLKSASASPRPSQNITRKKSWWVISQNLALRRVRCESIARIVGISFYNFIFDWLHFCIFLTPMSMLGIGTPSMVRNNENVPRWFLTRNLSTKAVGGSSARIPARIVARIIARILVSFVSLGCCFNAIF